MVLEYTFKKKFLLVILGLVISGFLVLYLFETPSPSLRTDLFFFQIPKDSSSLESGDTDFSLLVFCA